MSEYSSVTVVITLEEGAARFPHIAEVFGEHFLGYAGEREVWRLTTCKRDQPGVVQGLRCSSLVYHVGTADPLTDRRRASRFAGPR